MTAIEIRPATDADAEAIAAVHVAAWRETYEGLAPAEVLAALSVEERAARWRAVLSEPDAPTRSAVFLALAEDGSAAGFASCGPQRREALSAAGYKGEFSAVYILKSAQRRGVGRRLMALMAENLLARSLDRASLWVLRNNFPSRRFYEALGGRKIAYEGLWHGVPEVAYAWRDLTRLVSHQ
ncbi:MAG: GNAT family N-acetyltransferase [Methylocystaceae bacterium]|nr:MAG: GNAT family N-acetyltransferase [Methylocystaceae bacterium]